jgi:hypothetical protein
MNLTILACAACLFAIPATADCLFIGGDSQRACPPGEKIVKNGPGNGTVFFERRFLYNRYERSRLSLSKRY